MCFVTHFLSVCGFYFHFPNSVFSRTELLNCNKIQLIRLFFHRSCFRCFIQKVFESLGSLRFTFMLSYRNFMVLHFAFRSITHFEFIFVKVMKSVFRFWGASCDMISIVPAPFVENTLSIKLPFLLCQREVGYICVGLFLGLLF